MPLTIEPDHEVGLTDQQVADLTKEWGLNHVAAKSTPEWKKILDRYLDWVSLIIVSGWGLGVLMGVGRAWGAAQRRGEETPVLLPWPA